MALLQNLPEQASLIDVIRAFREPMRHLNPFVQSLMRGPSPLSEGEREMIAAFVSGLNACSYCHGIHSATAAAFGIEAGDFEILIEDVDAAPVETRLKPLLKYVKKLTETPSKMAPADAEAVYAAGWNDEALFHAIAVCAYFNLINRIVDGSGVAVGDDYLVMSGNRLAEQGYGVVKRLALDDS